MMIYIVVLGGLGFVIYFLIFRKSSKKLSTFPRRFDSEIKDNSFYDAAIVGAGPAGATCGYFMAKSGRRVLLLEKKKFPRDKYCGDAVCKTAIEILHEMGIYKELLEQDKARVADNGGLVSPGGLSFIGRSKELMGEIPAALACKRIHLDMAIAMAAKKAGADLKEDSSVASAVFDGGKKIWTIRLDDSNVTYQARVLICADGAPSRLATQLGIVTDPPNSISSRAYVKPGTHQFKADGVVFYPRDVLPGYAAIFRHPKNELNYCVYLIPGNPRVTMDDLPAWHEKLMKDDPFISRALGPNVDIERMKAASLRLGGVKKSYGEHVIVVGDAAGMIDPMTGEGIHHAMDGGKLAAQFVGEALKQGNCDEKAMAIYQQRWMDRFGSDFRWSMVFCQMMYRFPIFLDAATAAIIRKGDKFLARWADIMTGRVPKIHLLKPEFVIVITYELLLLLFKKMLGMNTVKTSIKYD